jgi:hypothetical protein
VNVENANTENSSTLVSSENASTDYASTEHVGTKVQRLIQICGGPGQKTSWRVDSQPP